MMSKLLKKLLAATLAAAMACPAVSIAQAAPAPVLPDDNVYIEDSAIRVTVDDYMNMVVYRNDSGEWTQITQPITPLDENGATAVTGAPWKNQLPWSTYEGNFNTGSARIWSANTNYVVGGERGVATGHPDVTNDARETLLADDFKRQDADYQTDVDTYFGKGNRLTVTGYSDTAALEHKLVVETNPAVPGAAAVTSYYTYQGGEEALLVAKFVNNNFKITDEKPEPVKTPDRAGNEYYRVEAGLWELHGCPQRTNADYINPAYDTLGTGSINNFNSGTETLARNNFSWANSGAGFPLNDFWGMNVGFLIGSMMPSHTYSMELPQRGSGIAGNHETAYTWIGFPGKTLQKGSETYIGTSIIGVHTGDYFDGANLYARAMDNVELENNPHLPDAYDKNLLRLPTVEELPDWVYEPSYETWGYGEDFLPENLMDCIELYKVLGIKSVTYDAGWYQRNGTNGEGVYWPAPDKWAAAAEKLSAYFGENPHPKTEAAGDAYDYSVLPCTTTQEAIKVVRALNEYIHVNGMYVKAWVMEPQARAGVPDSYYAKNENGQKYGSSRTFLCTGTTAVLDDYTDYFCTLMFGTGEGQYAFDGLKGDSFYGMPLCYDTTHSHGENVYGAIEGFGQFFKNIYDKANYIRGATESVGGPVIDNQQIAVIKNCMCGKPMDYYTWSGTNSPVPGDNIGSRQMRHMTKLLKGFYGPNFAVDSDHVFLSTLRRIGENERSGPIDFISYLGMGSALSTKFITDRYYDFNGDMDLGTDMHGNSHVNRMNFPGEPNYTYATGAAHSANSTYEVFKWGDFVKYFGLFQDMGLASKDYTYLNLYKYAFDYPEGHAYQGDGEYFYSFFATDNGVDNSKASNCLIDPWGTANNYASGYSTYTGEYESANTYAGDIELRGLLPTTLYYITDVVTGRQWSGLSDTNGLLTLTDIEFTTGIIFKVSKMQTTSIFGNVFDSEKDITIAGADLTLVDAATDRQIGAQTAADLDGNYCFPLVPDGTYRIQVTTYKGPDGELYTDPDRNPYKGEDGPAYTAGVTMTPYEDYTTRTFTATGGELFLDIDLTAVYQGEEHHVAPSGNDTTGNGSPDNPYRTIQKGLSAMAGGDTLLIHAGTYEERVTVGSNLSGYDGLMTVITNAGDGEVIIDGGGSGTVISVSNGANILIEGLTVTNAATGISYSTAKDAATLAMANELYDRDKAPGPDNISPFRNIIIKGNTVYNINSSNHGISVYANNYMAPVTGLVIDGNVVWGTRTYWSEAVVINGNIDGFDICHNLVYNNNNIGIDMIGFEGTARIPLDNGTNAHLFPDPAGTPSGNLGRDRFNMAKNGRCYDNVVYGSCVINNEAYWEEEGGYLGTSSGPAEGEYDRCCNGIYVDGGMNIEIYHNLVFDNDIGIEISTEHAYPDYWVEGMYVHDNIIAGNMGWNGLSIGGQSLDPDFPLGGIMGQTKNSRFENNILYGNVVNLNIQHTANNTIKNNIIMGGDAAVMDWLAPLLHSANNFEENIWYNSGGLDNYYVELDRIEGSQLSKQIKVDTQPLLDPDKGDFTVLNGYDGYGTNVSGWGGADWTGGEWTFDTAYLNLFAEYVAAYQELTDAIRFLEEEGPFDFEAAAATGNLRTYLNGVLQEAGFKNAEVPYILKVFTEREGLVDGWDSPDDIVDLMNPRDGNNLVAENTKAHDNGNIDSNALTAKIAQQDGETLECIYLVEVINRYNGGKSFTQGDTRNGITMAVEGGGAVGEITNVLILPDSFVMETTDAPMALIVVVEPVDADILGIQWISNNEDVVIVDENGVITPLAEGSAMVTATVAGLNGNYTADCEITVVAAGALGDRVTGVSISEMEVTLAIGDTYLLTAAIEPAHAANQNVLWVSSDNAVIHVDENGVLEAIQEGQATITVISLDGGFTDTCLVTVTGEEVIRVTGIKIDSAAITVISIRDALQLRAIITPGDAANTTVTWTSSANNVATVDEDGFVKAIGTGMTVIVAESEDGGYRSQIILRVTY